MTKKAKLDFGGEAQVLTAGEVTRWLRIPKSMPYKLYQEEQVPATNIGRY